MLNKAGYTHSLLEIKIHFSHFVSICFLAYRKQTKLIILCYLNLEGLIYYFSILKTTALEWKKKLSKYKLKCYSYIPYQIKEIFSFGVL